MFALLKRLNLQEKLAFLYVIIVYGGNILISAAKINTTYIAKDTERSLWLVCIYMMLTCISHWILYARVKRYPYIPVASTVITLFLVLGTIAWGKELINGEVRTVQHEFIDFFFDTVIFGMVIFATTLLANAAPSTSATGK